MSRNKQKDIEDYLKWGSATPNEIYLLEKIEDNNETINIKESRKDIADFYNLRSALTGNFKTAFLTGYGNYDNFIRQLVAKRDLSDNVERYSKKLLKMFNKDKYEQDEEKFKNYARIYPSPLFYGDGNLLSLEDTRCFICDEPYDDTFLLHAKQDIFDYTGKVVHDGNKGLLVEQYTRYFEGTKLFDKKEENDSLEYVNNNRLEQLNQNPYIDNIEENVQ